MPNLVIVKKSTIALIVTGILFIIAGVLFIAFCYMVSDPEIEGDSARTPLSTYLLSFIPISLGTLIIILSYKGNKKKF